MRLKLAMAAVVCGMMAGRGLCAPATTQAVETSEVKRGELPLKFDATGYFEAEEPVEVRLKLKVYNGELTINAVGANGAVVKKGDKLLEIDPKPLQKVLDAAANDATTAHANLTRAEADAKLAAAAEELAMRMQQDAVKDAETAVKWFEETDGPDSLKAADLELKQWKDSLEDRTDELDQLKKLYKEDDLTNATADIVTKRAVRGVEQTTQQYAMAQHRNEKSKTVYYPISSRKVHDTLTQAKQALASLEVAQAQAKIIRETGLVTTRAAVAAADEKFADLKADLDKLTVTAPQDGVMWYGQLNGGNWANGGPKALRVGEKTAAQTVLMTLYTPGKLRLVMDLSEGNYFTVPNGTKVTITPTAYPEMRLEGECDAAPRTPTMTQTGAIYPMAVKIGKVDEKLIPGERASVKVLVPPLEKVLLVPTTAVVQGFVWVHSADGKDEKRAVVTGRAEGKSIEIVDGVKEGEKVLTVGKP